MIEERLDRGEREAACLQRADPLEAVEVGGAVAHRATRPLAGREQAFALVVADGVDGDAGQLSQLVDPPVAHGNLRSAKLGSR